MRGERERERFCANASVESIAYVHRRKGGKPNKGYAWRGLGRNRINPLRPDPGHASDTTDRLISELLVQFRVSLIYKNGIQ